MKQTCFHQTENNLSVELMNVLLDVNIFYSVCVYLTTTKNGVRIGVELDLFPVTPSLGVSGCLAVLL